MAKGSPQLEPLNVMVDLEESSDIMKSVEKEIRTVEGLDGVQPSSSSVAVVALSGSRKDRRTVKWALEKFAHEEIISFKMLHVRPVITRIPTPMGNFIPISQVREDVADAFKKDVEWQVDEKLLPCKRMCAQRKVQVEVVQIESDDVVRAIGEYVTKHCIRKLVIGASSPNFFSRRRTLSSKISQGCPHFCTVYVVSKGRLSSLRPSDSGTNGSYKEDYTSKTTDDSSSQSLSSQTFSLDQTSAESFSGLRPALHQLQQFQAISALNQALLHQRIPSSGSLASTNLSLINEETDVAGVSPLCSDPSIGDSGALFKRTENPPHLGALTASASLTKQVNVDFEIQKLRVQLRHMRGLYATAQGEATDASRKLNELVKRRTEEEENLRQICCKEEEGKELAKEMNEKYEAAKKDAEIVNQCAEIEARERREAEIRASRETREKQSLESVLNNTSLRFRQFTWEEIVSATSSFSDDLKIGMGAYGSVYKCNFQHTTAAVKVHSKEAHRDQQFYQELEILSQNRHPNLLILIGACPDHGCLVYEFMKNGSLEDRLMRKDNTPPLAWSDRIRIGWEVSSALLFLHHSKPRAIIHRDLKPGNILLDGNNVSKIGDLGLSLMLSEEDISSPVAVSDAAAPMGTVCYIDPEYHRTGVISPKSDVYALGMVILQLLTGKPAIALALTVEVALESDCLEEVLDQEAGSWPVQETRQLAALALKCTELRQTDRPDLQDEVLPFLEKMKNLAEKSQDLDLKTATQPPNHFVCPILKEIMADPCVAADGYTYDRNAIESWLEKSDTSPITKRSLPHKALIPNYALLSAIMEWTAGKRT